ncbi:hypothetical protein DFS34DRAFT_593462 [Phlyctochytrium arcticum]|nr:hypothetical protein DFS34DRAFT_593462 [Phlyctochytrium arcticum]
MATQEEDATSHLIFIIIIGCVTPLCLLGACYVRSWQASKTNNNIHSTLDAITPEIRRVDSILPVYSLHTIEIFDPCPLDDISCNPPASPPPPPPPTPPPPTTIIPMAPIPTSDPPAYAP